MKQIKVIIESPYAGDVEKNLSYARECILDSLVRGEAPIASHLLYTQEGILNDDIPEQRELGINAGLAWLDVADKHVFYVDLGMSDGMLAAEHIAIKNKIHVEYRRILNGEVKIHGPEIIGKSLLKSIINPEGHLTWVSVERFFPITDKSNRSRTVIVCDDIGTIGTAFYDSSDGKWLDSETYHDYYDFDEFKDVKYWRDFPISPLNTKR